MKEQISLCYRQVPRTRFTTPTWTSRGRMDRELRLRRRGSTLQTGTKTSEPSPSTSQKIYDKIVAEKMAKGYTPAAGGTPYVGTRTRAKSADSCPSF